jgi:hypothetical protein
MSLRSVAFVSMTLALCCACSSGQGTPATTDSGATMDSGASSGKDSGKPTDGGVGDAGSATTWTFSGGKATASLSSGKTPSAITIPSAGDVSTSVTIQLEAPSSGGSLMVSSAENGCCGLSTSDVSPKTLPPDDMSSSGISGSTSNHPVLYLSFFNPGTNPIDFGAKTPAITLSPTAGGTIANDISGDAECQLDWLGTDGHGKSSWTVIPGSRVMLSLSSATVSIPAAALSGGDTLTFEPGQTVGAISCD